MLFQEVTTNSASSDSTKIALEAVILLLSNSFAVYFTYRLTKPRTASETLKNLADAHKSEADTHKSEADTEKVRADTIKLLNDELEEALVTAKALRRRIAKFEALYETEIKVILTLLDKVLGEINDVVNYLISNSILPDIRMKMVRSLNSLYTIKDILKKRQLDGDE